MTERFQNDVLEASQVVQDRIEINVCLCCVWLSKLSFVKVLDTPLSKKFVEYFLPLVPHTVLI